VACLIGYFFLPLVALSGLCAVAYAVYRDGKEKRALELHLEQLKNDQHLLELNQRWGRQ
jgi:hypothetical protein